MVSRLESILFLLLVMATIIGLSIHLQTAKSKKAAVTQKKIEINRARLKEYNASGLTNDYQSSVASLIGSVWYFDDFYMENPDIKFLKSRKAQKDKKGFMLEGDVRLRRLDDSSYRAEKVLYLSGKGTLQSIGPFYGEKELSWVKGVNFHYDMKRKVTKASRVFAHYLVEQNRSSAMNKDNNQSDIINRKEGKKP